MDVPSTMTASTLWVSEIASMIRSQWPLWVAPALQVFFGDIRGLFVSTVVCPACLCFGIASTGPDEFRERGSNRLIDLKGP